MRAETVKSDAQVQKWLMRAGSKGATVGKLAYALYLCSRIDLVNCLIRISQS